MKRFLIYIIVVFIGIFVLLPVVFWQMGTSIPLNIAIIDKTVPDESYREHLGITWLLNHLKYTDQAKNEYQVNEDYYGFMPYEREARYEIRSIPQDFSDFDVIYLADTYGVYEEDLPWIDKIREGARSEVIYGGLDMVEWQAIRERLDQEKQSLLIAEYNIFASPTDFEVMEHITQYLGLEWSGWTGRFFDELDFRKNIEIPQWTIDEFGDTWHYEGPGFILVNDLHHEVIVLEQGKHIDEEGIRLSFTEEGEALFGLNKQPEYTYWFDIVVPRYGSTVLANYDWTLTEEGKMLLEEHGVPSEFAAVLTIQNGASQSFYFAGDYNDVAKLPHYY